MSTSVMLPALWKHFNDGGFGMYPLAACFVLLLTVAFERSGALFVATWGDWNLRHGVRRALLGRDLEGAVTLCKAHHAPIARALGAGLREAHATDGRIQLTVDAAVLAEIPKLWRRIPAIVPIGGVGFCLGLLGTLTGLVKGYGCVGGESLDPSQKARIIAEGVSEAMNCTAFGLIVGITAVGAHGILRHWAEALEQTLRETVVETLSLVSVHRTRLFASQESVEQPRGEGCLRLARRGTIVVYWGDDFLDCLHWRRSSPAGFVGEYADVAGAPGTHLKLYSDRAGNTHWTFDQSPCPPVAAFRVEVEASDDSIDERPERHGRNRVRRAKLPLLSFGPFFFHARYVAAAVVALTSHLALLTVAATTVPPLSDDDTSERVARDLAPRIASSSWPAQFELIRVVSTPETIDITEETCARGVHNCEFLPWTSPTAKDPLVGPRPQAPPLRARFLRTVARARSRSQAGYAFYNWQRAEGAPVETTGLPRIHAVRRGETLRSIALKYGLPSWHCIRSYELNLELMINRPNPDVILAGDTIRIPTRCLDGSPYGPLGWPLGQAAGP